MNILSVGFRWYDKLIERKDMVVEVEDIFVEDIFVEGENIKLRR